MMRQQQGFWEKPHCHQTWRRSSQVENLLKWWLPPLTVFFFFQGCCCCVIPLKQRSFYISFRVLECIHLEGFHSHTAIFTSEVCMCVGRVVVVVGSSGKCCHQANCRLIQACCSGLINLSTTFLLQTSLFSHIHLSAQAFWLQKISTHMCNN